MERVHVAGHLRALLALMTVLAVSFAGFLPSCVPGPRARLRVESDPQGAAVFVDGKEVGKTPALLEKLEPGKRQVTLAYPGYQEWSTEVNLVPGQEQKIAASLAPIPSGVTFEVRSDPPEALVFIDGGYCGLTPVNVSLPESPFCLTVEKPGYLWVQEFLSPADIRSAPRSYSPLLKVGGMTAFAYLLPGGFDPQDEVLPVDVPSVSFEQDRVVIGPLETPSPLQIPNVPRISPAGDYLAMVVTAPPVNWVGQRWGETLVVVDLKTGRSRILLSTSGAVLGESQRLGLPGIRILGFYGKSEIVILTWSQGQYVPEFEIRVLDVETGQERTTKSLFSPADGRQISSWWFSRDGRTLFLELYRVTDEILAVDLVTGEARVVYSGVPQSPVYRCPVIAPSPEGWRILWGMKLEREGLHLVDLQTGLERTILERDIVFNEALWSPDGRLVAVPVGRTAEVRPGLHPYQDRVLLADAVVVLSSTGERVMELSLPDKLIAETLWLSDSGGLIVKTAELTEDWNQAHRGTYVLGLDGSKKELLSGEVLGATLLTDLPSVESRWIFFSSWEQNQEDHWAFESDSGAVIPLPAKPVAVAGDLVLVRSSDGRIEQVLLSPDGTEKLGEVPAPGLQWWDVVEFTGDLLVIDGEKEVERSGRFVMLISVRPGKR